MKNDGKVKFKAQIEQHEGMDAGYIRFPNDVKVLLDDNTKEEKYFEGLSYTYQKEYIRWIESAKQPETRARRTWIFLDMLNAGKTFMDS